MVSKVGWHAWFLHEQAWRISIFGSTSHVWRTKNDMHLHVVAMTHVLSVSTVFPQVDILPICVSTVAPSRRFIAPLYTHWVHHPFHLAVSTFRGFVSLYFVSSPSKEGSPSQVGGSSPQLVHRWIQRTSDSMAGDLGADFENAFDVGLRARYVSNKVASMHSVRNRRPTWLEPRPSFFFSLVEKKLP